ncbi:MAPEG family protein [Alcanivorax marinus]|uniref:MAPEG family protein n=1 Tax=Alloalcanivorax marinus TaxID=1177169 RepID=A0A9Q3UPQ5_9GAMM|nr:MAPEG family protein [Alloalcanivorax marinus]MCC4310360.1 MAPEG family protein [Alloalcanivorax marinus]
MFPITALYAALCGLLILALAFNVVRYRFGRGVSLGDGGDVLINRAVRAHGNTVEYVPLALILIGLLEGNNGNAWALHLYGLLLVLGRLAHAWGMLKPGSEVNTFRKLGIIATWLVLLAASVHLLVIVGLY